MLRLFDPNKCVPPKPWIARVLADTESRRWLGLTGQQWLLNAVLWAGIIAVALVVYSALK